MGEGRGVRERGVRERGVRGRGVRGKGGWSTVCYCAID